MNDHNTQTPAKPWWQMTGWRGPNIPGVIVIGGCIWLSYANWSLWPMVTLIVICIPSLIIIAWEYITKPTTRWWMLDDAERIPWLSFVASSLVLILACRMPSAWRYIVHGEPPRGRT